jgi:hypothetical protein
VAFFTPENDLGTLYSVLNPIFRATILGMAVEEEDAVAKQNNHFEDFEMRGRGREYESTPTKFLLGKTEKALQRWEGERNEDLLRNREYGVLNGLLAIEGRVDDFQLSTPEIVYEYGAEPVEGCDGWFVGNSIGDYALERRPVEIKRVVSEEADLTGKIAKRVIRAERRMAYRLGSDEERGQETEKIGRYAASVESRLKFGSMRHMYFQNIENINGLAIFYFVSNMITREDLDAYYNMPFAGEIGRVVTKGGVEIGREEGEKGKELGQMIDLAQRLYEAVGLSEDPTKFLNELKNSKGWDLVIDPNLSQAEKDAVSKEWFGDYNNWTRMEDGRRFDSREAVDGGSGVRTVENETRDGYRGKITKNGNIFRGDTPEHIQETRAAVVEFLGGGKAAELAENLGWWQFRITEQASCYGCQMYKDEGGKWIWMTEMGGDVSSDEVKTINPAAYQDVYTRKGRGGGPIGSLQKIKPFAVDVYRGVMFEKGYKLPDGTVIDHDISLRELVWKHGLRLGQVNYKALPERPILRPYLSMFMAGREKIGTFVTETDESIMSPEMFLTPGFWHSLFRSLDVGITTAVVYKGNLEGASKDPNKSATVKEYKLSHIRAFLDGVLSTPLAKKWDTRPEEYGEASAIPFAGDKEWFSKTITDRMITLANNVIPGLNYSNNRVNIQKQYGVKI